MKKTDASAKLTLFANRAVAVIVVVLLFTLPMLLDWYCGFRALTRLERTALTAAFYACAGVIGLALWHMDRLLLSILAGQVFTKANVRRISHIRWCCGAVALICIPAAACYYPLIFLVLIMGFLFLAVSVVCRVMSAAVELQEENDLTV